MRIIIELTVPGTQFAPGRKLDGVADVSVEFEPTVATSGDAFPYMWVDADDHARFREEMQTAPNVESLRLLDRDGDRGLYRANWRPDHDDFMSVLCEMDLIVVSARGSADGWAFELWFDRHDAVAQFQKACSERDIRYTVEKVTTERTGERTGSRLSECQREALLVGLENGFFEVPRETTVVELADELGVSDQAVSARIRRAIRTLVETHVRGHAGERNPKKL